MTSRDTPRPVMGMSRAGSPGSGDSSRSSARGLLGLCLVAGVSLRVSDSEGSQYCGVRADELAGLRPRLVEFTAQMLDGAVRRSDQRAKGELYVRGLLTDGQRKSMQPMAERLGVDHQQLQQFITSSTWDFTGVRRRLAARICEVVAPVAWVIDDTGFPKCGTSSPGVARQYSGTLGKVASCQIGVSVHAVTDHASAVLDWRLFIPQSWDRPRVTSTTPHL